MSEGPDIRPSGGDSGSSGNEGDSAGASGERDPQSGSQGQDGAVDNDAGSEGTGPESSGPGKERRGRSERQKRPSKPPRRSKPPSDDDLDERRRENVDRRRDRNAEVAGAAGGPAAKVGVQLADKVKDKMLREPLRRMGLGVLVDSNPAVRAALIAIGVFALVLFAAGGGAVYTQAANCAPADEAIASQSTESLQGVPKKYVPVYIGAAEKFKLGERGPSILAGIHKVETNFGTSTLPGVQSGVNSYGCCAGPMQFSVIPSADTWGAYAVDGDGDGDKDVYDNVDSIYTAARLLKASGAPGSWYDAIFAYNHADWYVKDVEDWAAKFRKAGSSMTSTTEVSQTTQTSSIDSDARISGVSEAYEEFGILVARGTGISLRVMGAWMLAEGGPDDNPLNIGPGKTYGSIEAGAKATIELLTTSSYYKGIIASTDKSDEEQIAAIVASPWCPAAACPGYEELILSTLARVEASGDPGSTTVSDDGDDGCNQPDAPSGATGPAQLEKAVRLTEPQTFTKIPAKYMNYAAPQPFDTRLMPDLIWVLETYDLKVNAARESGHATHGDGTAVDLAPGEDAASIAHWDETAKRLAEDLGWNSGCAASGTAPVCPLKPAIQFVGYNGYDSAHGDPSHTGSPHIHVSWQSDCYGCGGGALVEPRGWVMAFPAPGIDIGDSK